MISLFLAGLAAGAAAPPLRDGLRPLDFLVGHCWVGEMPKTGERDTKCFEPVFGGQHVRERHKVEGGKAVYEGETLYSWDGKVVTFTYWNSLGGVSRGTMQPSEGRLEFGDESYKGPDGRTITFSSHWRRLADGSFEAVTTSKESPSLNRTITYRKVGRP